MAESEFKSTGGFKRVLNATGYSIKGFRYALNHEAAFRQELALAVILTPLAWWLAKNRWEFLAMFAPMMLVLIIEAINSSIEALADEISLERRVRLGAAKDLGSSAVFIALSLTVLTWVFVLWP
jgi:diacylglycerol kinase (ATP)